MPTNFQLRTAINDQHTGKVVLVPGWDGRCEVFPQQAYDPAQDDTALDRALTQWGIPSTCQGPVLVDIEYVPNPDRMGPVPEADYRDPRKDEAHRDYYIRAIKRIKTLRPNVQVGAYLSCMGSMAGAARTTDERERWSQLIKEQQLLNNQLAPLIRELNWVGVPLYRKTRTYADGTPFNYSLRDSELVAEATRVVHRSNSSAVCVALVTPFTGLEITGVPTPDPEAIMVPLMLAKAMGWAGACWWGNAANKAESDHLLRQVPWVERMVATIKPLLMRGTAVRVRDSAEAVVPLSATQRLKINPKGAP